MHRFWLVLVIASLSWSASDNWREILDRVRDNVLRQVKKSTNYTCVQSIDRTSFRNKRDLLEGCAYDSTLPEKQKILHDRLRLDIAVSEGREIFAWHGAGKFSGSSTIADVVRRGALSSGEFIGFLENVFGHAGVRFEFTGENSINGLVSYSFNYTVPLASSGYHVRTRTGDPTVPFHGSFSVRASDLRLTNLSVVPDAIPEDSQICSVETEMQYQVLKISGQDALIPSLFVLKLDDADHLYTVSRSEYSQCHAFKAESTLRFDVYDSAASTAIRQPEIEEHLSPGTLLHIALQTPIDDQTSYTGDAVEGVLLNPIKLKGAHAAIPKGAVVNGVITMLEDRKEPKQHFFLSIEFDRLASNRGTFLFHAVPLPSKPETRKLTEIYGTTLPLSVRDTYREGALVFTSPRLHLDHGFSADWITREPAAAAPAFPATVPR